jgi:hypothetical protein
LDLPVPDNLAGLLVCSFFPVWSHRVLVRDYYDFGEGLGPGLSLGSSVVAAHSHIHGGEIDRRGGNSQYR